MSPSLWGSVSVSDWAEKRHPLGFGLEHGLEQGQRTRRRLLCDRADARIRGLGDVAPVEVQLAQDQLEERGLAGAVAADQADTAAGGQARAGARKNLAAGNPVYDIFNRQHFTLLGAASSTACGLAKPLL